MGKTLARPARFTGWYVIGQSLTGLLLSAILSFWLLPAFGAQGGIWALAGFIFLATLAVRAIPSRMSTLSQSKAGRIPSSAGMIGLLMVVLYMGASLAIWAYILPLAAASGMDQKTANITVTVGLGAQMLGGLAATYGRGWHPAKILGICAFIELASVTAMTSISFPTLFIVTGCIFCFSLTLGISFFIPFLEVLDPSRLAGTFCGGAQLLGQSFGVYCASIMVGSIGIPGAGYTGIAMLLSVMVTIALSTAYRSRVKDDHISV